MIAQSIVQNAIAFKDNVDAKKAVESVWEKHREFLKVYPFRAHPEEIDSLTPERIYNPGQGDYFFTWIEHRLKNLGHLRIGSALVWENARANEDKLRELLKTAVDEALPISKKIDAHWEDIKGFGGDKQIAKKIIFVYYPEAMLPIFKTEDLEYFATKLEIDFRKEAIERFGKTYDMLSIGQQFELLNSLIMKIKNKYDELKVFDNVLFTRFLYETLPPFRPNEVRETKPLHSLGILFEPEYEQEVVYLFSVFHRDLGFPYIIKIRNEFPDAIVMTNKKEVKRVEFEVRASDFISHGHDRQGCDLIVCWENDMEEEQSKILPKIISIKDSIEDFM